MTAPAFRIVADGLGFPEGPTHLGDGAVAVVEMQGQRLTRVDEDGTTTVLGKLGGGPNGSALGHDGALYVANNGGLSATRSGGYWHAPEPFDGCVQRVAGGQVSVVAAGLPGPPPHRPNDLCFGPDGRLYVTDSHNWEDLRNLRPGRIAAVAADGAVTQVAEVPAMPNGIAFGPDGRLYVAQSLTRSILVFDWTPGASLGDPKVFAKLPTGSPDGMCFDSGGDLYVCASVGHCVHVYDAGGTLKQTIDVPAGAQPTNCCIGDGRLYVTFSMTGRLAAYELAIAPLPLYQGAIDGGNS
ncbi:SMP-30/gluconolactonase/LRE family protein [Nonomuraea wenchangensis]